MYHSVIISGRKDLPFGFLALIYIYIYIKYNYGYFNKNLDNFTKINEMSRSSPL